MNTRDSGSQSIDKTIHEQGVTGQRLQQVLRCDSLSSV